MGGPEGIGRSASVSPFSYSNDSISNEISFDCHSAETVCSPPQQNISVLSWNIGGGLAAGLTHPNFRAYTAHHQILLFQETHLLPDQADTLDIPDNFRLLSRERRIASHLGRQWGGVAALVDRKLPVTLRSDLSGPDLLALDFGDFILLNVYLLPEGSPWQHWSAIHPVEKLASVLDAVALVDSDKPVYMIGDMNGRIGCDAVAPHHPPRHSCDIVLNTRGRRLLSLVTAHDLTVLNGASQYGIGNDSWTSFQGADGLSRRSVIDLCFASPTALPLVTGFQVESPAGWSDHSPLILTLRCPMLGLSRANTSDTAPAFVRPPLPTETPLDRRLIETLHSVPSADERLIKLYGPALLVTEPLKVYTDGSCLGNGSRQPQAGAGVYFGPNHQLNTSARVCGEQTNNRGELFAVLLALSLAPLRRSLCIYTDSKYAIRSVVYWAPAHADCGWDCANSDILKSIQTCIQARPATVHFEYVKGHAGNVHNEASDNLAKIGARMPLSSAVFPPCPPPQSISGHSAVSTGPKVTAGIAETDDDPDDPPPLKRQRQGLMSKVNVQNHRGRDAVRAVQADHQQKIVEAARVGPGAFWDMTHKILDAKPKEITADFDAVARNFQQRMNPPEELPRQFSSDRLATHRLLASLIPDETEDVSEEQAFSSPFTAEDIAWAKNRIKERNLQSAKGYDGVAYKLILQIDNDALAGLLNECVASRDGPSVWFITLVIAIAKKGKSLDDPAGLRTVGLESCVLKLLTLLIHKRLYAWAEKRGVFPPSQNGFREGYRTNNNAFVLRCMIDRARALNKTLYVAFVDISNAFPSTEQNTLWLKLYNMGVSGSLFDWLRMLYTRMDYTVKLGDRTSDFFKALAGVLIGDPASPTLWNIYLADFRLLADADDPYLLGLLISHLEHADDMALCSYSAGGLQAHLDSFLRWCNDNFLVANALKSWILVFGPLPTIMPIFRLGEETVRVVDETAYVGLLFKSTTADVFQAHYAKKASSAEKVMHAIFGLERHLRDIPPEVGRALYMAQVDPILTSGCEVMLDVCPQHLDWLEKVQRRFIRRLLGIGDRSSVAALFTETNIVPIRYRRLMGAIGYLEYLSTPAVSLYARTAMLDSWNLCMEGHSGWAMDLMYVLRELPSPVQLPPLPEASPEDIRRVKKAVNHACRAWLQHEIEQSPKLYLLHGRLEPLGQGEYKAVVMYLRNYLRVINANHRKAVTRLLLSGHNLALERMRWADRYHESVPRERRLCRFCSAAVESPEHALLLCTGSEELVSLRDTFLTSIALVLPSLRDRISPSTAVICVQQILFREDTIQQAARFVYEVLEVYDKVPLAWPTNAQSD